MKSIIVTFYFFSIFTILSFAQLNPAWEYVYNGPGTPLSFDEPRAMCIDNMGNICIAVKSYGTVSDADYLTIKLTPAGDTLWTRRYNGTGNAQDIPADIAADFLGNVYVTGYSLGDTTNFDYVTIKYSPTGVEEWLATYNGPNVVGVAPGIDLARSIAVDDLGNVYVTGYSEITFNGNDILTIKYNSSGALEWVERYNGPLSISDEAYSIKVDGLGNVYVAGFVDANSGTRDYCTIKYSSAGVLQWLARYDGPDNKEDEARLLDLDNLGNVYVTGLSDSWATGFDFVTIKYDNAGIVQWISRYSYSSLAKTDTPRDIVVDDFGDCYVTGIARSDQNVPGFSTIKYSTLGVELWANRFADFNSEDAKSIALDNSGNVYVTGESGPDIYTVIYNTLGAVVNFANYSQPGFSQETNPIIAVDSTSGDIYVACASYNTAQNSDLVVVKFSSITEVDDQISNIPNKFNLLQNYPNPFNPSTIIKFTIPNVTLNGDVGMGLAPTVLTVYDVLGNEIATLVNGYKPAGTHEVEFNSSTIKNHPSSGVYFYQLKAGSFVETKKMLLMK